MATCMWLMLYVELWLIFLTQSLESSVYYRTAKLLSVNDGTLPRLSMLNLTLNRTSLILSPEPAQGCLSDVSLHLEALKDFYPDFNTWLNDKVMPGLWVGERSILVEYRGGDLAGFAIVKDDGFEKKLCCLRILEKYQKVHGMGVRLFERAFAELGTDKPLLSVAEERLPYFDRLFNYFGFEVIEEYMGRYRSGKKEYSFNGVLDAHFNKDLTLTKFQGASAPSN